MNSSNKPAVNRAVAALQSLLSQVSAIALREIELESSAAGSELPSRGIDILAHVEVFGRNHSLACRILAGNHLDNVSAALEEMRNRLAGMPGEGTPVLILPVLTPEVQMLCSQHSAGCVDLRGNGRLSIGEVFVSMRSLPRRAYHRPAATMRTPVVVEARASQAVLRGFPAVSVGISQTGIRAVGHAAQPYS